MTTEQRAELLAQRDAGVPWKTLQRKFGYGRTRLWMLWRAALAERDVHEHRGGLRRGQRGVTSSPCR